MREAIHTAAKRVRGGSHDKHKLNRRSFVVGAAAAAGGGVALSVGFPFGGPQVVRAQDGSPEVNAWVVIRPDDTVVIRIARSEMGQGTLRVWPSSWPRNSSATGRR